ncbi:MAG: hypothetical protein H0U73_09740 [Tatlockia sp.]|nr:hypothetical protein [Tatlockia sp.]
MKIELLKTLCGLAGVSGFEDEVREYLIEQWSKFLDELKVDGLGNLSGVMKSTSREQPKLNVLFMAHMDEVGLIVSHISDKGFVYFDALGGQNDDVLSGQIWHIHTEQGKVIGYTGIESGHTMPSFPSTDKLNQKQFFIDVGTDSREATEALGIRSGLPISYGGESFIQTGEHRILAKALDDRFALSLLTELLEKIAPIKDTLPFNIYIAATVQEELGMRGAKTVYKSLQVKPDLVINLDIGLARDYPLLYSQNSKNVSSTTPKLAGGLTITTYDSSMISNPTLTNYLINLSKKSELKYQLDSSMNSSTDGCCLQQSGRGYPVANIGIPVRYAHSHLNMMDSRDYDDLLNFLSLFCANYNLTEHNRIFPDISSATKKGFFVQKSNEISTSMPGPILGTQIENKETTTNTGITLI